MADQSRIYPQSSVYHHWLLAQTHIALANQSGMYMVSLKRVPALGRNLMICGSLSSIPLHTANFSPQSLGTGTFDADRAQPAQLPLAFDIRLEYW